MSSEECLGKGKENWEEFGIGFKGVGGWERVVEGCRLVTGYEIKRGKKNRHIYRASEVTWGLFIARRGHDECTDLMFK